MEDSIQSSTGKVLQEAADELGKIITDNLTNGTNATQIEKFKPTPEGLILAYTSLVIMALIPIIVGSFRSVKHQKNQQDSGEEIETMSTKEAMMFPLIASCTLFSIYIVFKLFSKEHINMLLACYFFLLGVIALTRMSSGLVHKIWPLTGCNNEDYDLNFSLTSGPKEKKNNLMVFATLFDRQAIMCFFLALTIGVWYILKKHWVANNIFGLAFAINGIEFLQLNQVLNGCILLCGLFFYDIFWVFGTDVMVSVAKSFDAPIKLIFPQDILENGLYADKMALLGLGDIVIPGIFIALLLRYDLSLKRNSKLYFYTCFFAYVLALFLTIFVMHVFKHAQPALLYIVPLCLIFPLTVALIKGDLNSMFAYRDHEEEAVEKKQTEEAANENDEKRKDVKKNK